MQYSFLIKGQPTQWTKPSSGIRQGDPLSPYLFILASQLLSFLLNKSMHEGGIDGFNFGNSIDPDATRLMYADDLILVCKASDKCCDFIFSA